MVRQIAAPFVDARAGDLRLALDRPAAPALCVARVERAGFEVELRILGYSHQVRVRRGEQELSEMVARLADGGGSALPGALERPGPGLRYAFRSETLAGGFEARAERLLHDLGEDPNALVGLFPGLAHAFTALRVGEADGTVRWQSWHAYPQSGEIVATEGRACAP